MVECFNQPDAADLKQIIHIFSAMVEPLKHTEHKTQIAPEEFLARLHIAAVNEGKELTHTFVGNHRQ